MIIIWQTGSVEENFSVHGLGQVWNYASVVTEVSLTPVDSWTAPNRKTDYRAKDRSTEWEARKRATDWKGGER